MSMGFNVFLTAAGEKALNRSRFTVKLFVVTILFCVLCWTHTFWNVTNCC